MNKIEITKLFIRIVKEVELYDAFLTYNGRHHKKHHSNYLNDIFIAKEYHVIELLYNCNPLITLDLNVYTRGMDKKEYRLYRLIDVWDNYRFITLLILLRTLNDIFSNGILLRNQYNIIKSHILKYFEDLL